MNTLTPELEALVQGYAEGSLTPEEAVALLAELKAQPELAAVIVNALQMDQCIRDTVKLQKVDELLPESSAKATAFKSGMHEHVATSPERRPYNRKLWMALGGAAVLVIGVLLYRAFYAETSQSIAELRSASHTTIERTGARIEASDGARVFDGDLIKTAADGSATLVYPDGTRTVFAANSAAQLGGNPATAPRAGKRVLLTSGELSASVAPQPAEQPFVFSTPQAQAVVVGTELRLAVHETATRLDVNKGKVRLTNVGSQQSVDVSGGEFAVAAPNVELAVAPQETVASRNFARGIAGAWLLGTGPGAILDDSGHNNHGIAFGNPKTVDEKVGKALQLDGDTQFVELEKRNAYDGLQRGTLMAWIRCDVPRREGRQMTIFSAQNADNEMLEFAVKNEQLIVWSGKGLNDNHEWTDAFTGATPFINRETWHHVAYVVSDSGNAFYIDGVRSPASFTTGSPDRPFFFAQALTGQKDTRYRIGASVDTLEECFHGAMRDVQLFDRPLTEAELRAAAQPR